jgi:hypothetical protein
MIYREGGSEEIWGRLLSTRIVHDAEEEARAVAAGWLLRPDQHPLDHDGNGRKGGSRKRPERTPEA